MIKLIPIGRLRPGMYIHDLNCGWLQHDFVRNRFLVEGEDDVRKVRAIGVREVYVDTARGLDPDALPLAPAAAPAAAPASGEAPAVRTGSKAANAFERARALHREATQIVRDMLVDIRLGKQIELEKVEPLVTRIVDSIFTQQDALLPLARLKQHDNYTFQHSVSVCALMTAFARTLELPREIIREIAIGALLHDVGKARVPDEILNKPARLTDAEFEKMKNHVVQSKIILQATPGISDIALDVAAQHHERHDGTGYPNRLKGEAISLYGQMGAIVDVYDAITSNRVYHKGMPPTEALRKILEWSAMHFKPTLVQAFIRSVGIYPTGSLVRLESRRLAVVQAQHADKPMQPTVKVIFHTAGHYLQPEDVDLRRSQDQIVGYEDFAVWNIDTARWLPS
ncbi:HD-GYP domain-containing protein [Thauera sp. 2A1]|uniref:HD-GYP domain-containing protein n=1 Tax=Thauera sp. 2A1 TaxID=2570191 RepID=UPI001291E265|nr:HD-GYP domain-containing protein [Thauera sp. 2A1]KAI5915344.1 HD-GYP domain-containing protein [Thauera sp. 2A1]